MASSEIAQTVTLIELVPEGIPEPKHFAIVDSPIPVCGQEGDLVLQVMAMSADPYLRGGIKTGEVPRPMTGFVAGKVIESQNEAWPVGSLMGAALPFSSVQLVTSEVLSKTMSWNLTDHISEDEITLGIGVLGMPGSTAYGGLTGVLRPNEGETLFVSAAAGAVGSLVGQMAKAKYNCTVVGSCGGAAKNELVKAKFGFDHAIDYKELSSDDKAAELASKIKEAVPDGIDMYFENVGGYHFEAAMATLRPKGRIAVCGSISTYNYESGTAPLNNINISQMIYTFQRIEGFVCMPWLTGRQGNFLADVSQWYREGKLNVEETTFDGIHSWVDAFAALFTGANTGKVVVKL
uniref:Enoyl reductase (ER) domain-containing protein n=1 Tax=Florenciella parvula TaxID=236787 RepID=A0A7S2BSP8_9STRA|mmetsp:Transcript_20018/g.42137  ORF Transcript_20018/g.42137 Transcript_20018/m.42137 type:complete len:349 (+) Transcript_20018:110-1156(+)|eukprot:CAMPEP_0119482898 /NCGR_PEP_ID=MMETSP1344-20130328/10552_1 /TAXON_ID=236787 /ORGANISM="Florenciella parvula, Strain CCMP2471" /LENGTH=348 /DNA_ID=CAMNT_0007517351 /DNA_START=134 /DNA_END=1180 /DNA_ORIENTATION=-